MKKYTLIILFCISFYYLETTGQQKILDRIVAVVDKEFILESELNQQVEFYVFNNKVDPKTPGLKKQVLDAMINEKLIVASALEDTNIVVTEDEITQQLDVILQQRILQIGSEEKLEEIYKMPISKIKREFRDEMKKQLLAQRLQQFKFANMSVTKREIEEFFETYKDSLPEVPEEIELYHLLKIPSKGKDIKEKVKIRANAILDSLKSGGDFSEFANRYSDDKGSAAGGGDLGFTRRGQFVKEYEEAAFSLSAGQISDLVESPFGFHIIQLLERRGENVNTRHILFKIEPDESTDKLTIDFLNSLIDSIKSGVSFTDLAQRHSDDVETASIGGYLGLVPVDQLDKEFSQTVLEMEVGEVSPPEKVNAGKTYGYQIVYLKKRIPAHKFDLNTDWKKLEAFAINIKRGEVYQNWLNDLRNEIFWEIRL